MSLPDVGERTFRWVMVVRGRRWRLLVNGEVRGFVRQVFDTWDAYVCTGKNWHEGSDKRVRFNLGPQDNPFYKARRAVEEAIADVASPKKGSE